MITLIFLLFGTTQFSAAGCSPVPVASTSDPVSHELWTELLQKHVAPDGRVDYNGFKQDLPRLREYTGLLSAHHPNDSWSENERLAYWINAYNAFTILLVAEDYPVESIKDIKRGVPFVNSVWDIKFIEIEGQTYDLNNIEHGILRKEFDEPRIHFAVNCASVSCPVLRNEAYTAEAVDAQLDEQARQFLSDPKKNVITRDAVTISKIFRWFTGDFKKNGTLIDYLNQYAEVEISADADISYMDWDWGIND